MQGNRSLAVSTQLARRALRHGHFEVREGVYQSCPVCGLKIVSPRLMGRVDPRDLRRLMVEHIRFDDDCLPPKENADG